MDNKMLLWECTYKVVRSNDSFYVKDWIYSTSKPSDKTIGHYWRHLFNYQILEGVSYIAPSDIDIDKCIIQSTPFEN